MVRGAERAWIVVVVPIAVIPVEEWVNAMEWMPPTWPIAPVVWRMPCHPRWSPKPVVDRWTVDIYRFDDIVGTIDIFITYHLHRDLVRLIFLHKDRCHVLVDIFCQHGLYHHQVTIAVCRLYHTQVIHFAIAVQVKVRECGIGVIQQLLKLLQVFGLSEKGGYSLEVEILRDVGGSSGDGHGLVCQQLLEARAQSRE